MSDEVGARFDHRAQRYDNRLTAWLGERELRCIRPLVPDGSVVLDYGCGTGRTTLDLLRRGCQVTAYDLSAEMLALAEAKAVTAGRTAEWLTNAADLHGRAWPIITLIGVLDYYREPTALLHQVTASLAPEGRLVATWPNAWSPLALAYGLASRCTVPAIPRSLAAARHAVAAAGLAIESVHYACPACPCGHTMIFSLRRQRGGAGPG